MFAHTASPMIIPTISTTEANNDFIVYTQSSFAFLQRCMKFLLRPIISFIRYGLKHPISTPISFVSSLPIGMYGLTFLSEKQPRDISGEWWANLTTENKLFSVFNALVAISINMLTNSKFLPLFSKKLKENLKQCCKSIASFSKNNLLLLIGISAALIYGAIAYQSFSWLNEIVSAIFALTNVIIYGARRYFGAVDLIDKVRNLFDKDVRFQQACVQQLKHLKEKYREEFDSLIQDEKITDETVSQLLDRIYNKATELARDHEFVFNEQTTWDKFTEKVCITANTTNALFSAAFVLPVGIQMGYRGAVILTFSLIDQLNSTSKIFCGLIPGAANAIFYYTSVYDAGRTVSDMLYHSKKDRGKLPLIITLTGLNALTASSYFTVAAGSFAEGNVFAIVPGSLSSRIVSYGNAYAVFMAGLSNTDIVFTDQPIKNPTFDDFTHWLERNKLSKEKIHKLRKHSFFHLPKNIIELEDNPSAKKTGPRIRP